VHCDLHTISSNDIEREGSRNSMVVGIVQINFDLWLVRQPMPTVDQGMGVWGTWGRCQFVGWYSTPSSFQAMGETGLSDIVGHLNTF
jgi:hypothetical protein